jgi:beta-lactamase class A
MQSTFKLPLAICVLRLVQIGDLKLDQPVRFLPSDRYPGSYSPLQDAHPDANVDVPLRELLRLSAGLSDNIATDILLRLVGGPQAVQRTVDSIGLPNIHVRDSERSMHDHWDAQYRNDAPPEAFVQLLRQLSTPRSTLRSNLKPEYADLLLKILSETPSGAHRIKGLLPPGTPVAHKTGTSDTKDGLTPATNDAGIITLPDGRKLYLAVFVTDAHADEATREGVIARIAKAVYDAAIAARP